MNVLPDPIPGRLWAVFLPRRASTLLLELVARFAAGGTRHPSVRVLDGGNGFNAYTVAGLLRRQTPQVEAALQRIHVARAFTCYQMLSLLEGAPVGPIPIVVLDLLVTFGDENVSLEERRWLFEQGLSELKRLSARAPVVVSAHLAAQPNLFKLAEVLQAAAGQVWRFDPLVPPQPPRLF